MRYGSDIKETAGIEDMISGARNATALVNAYTRAAEAYQELWEPMLRPFSLRLLDMAPLPTARRVLDLGCGVGALLPEIEARAPMAQIVGADLTEAMVRRAPGRFYRLVMDCLTPALAPHSFDAVISSFMLFHVPEPLMALANVRELLRPGGGLALAVWGAGETFPAQGLWDEELNRAGVPKDPVSSGPDGREQVNSAEKMTSLLEAAGFTDASTTSVEWSVQWTLDHFIATRKRIGPSGRRLALLDPAAREAVIAQARSQIERQGGESLRHHDEVLLASARVAN